MPVAVVQDWVEPETDRSTTNYDTITERLNIDAEPARGLIVHTAGYTGNGFRIFEVWESRNDFDAFMRERLGPLIQDVAGADSAPPDLLVYELHNLALGQR